MSITRLHRKRHNFTIIDNSGAEDTTLSLKGKGLLWYLLTKPDGWEVRNEHLMSALGIGKDQLASAVRDLEESGYLIRIKYQAKSGKFDWIVEVFETPQDCQEWKDCHQDLVSLALGGSTNCRAPKRKRVRNKISTIGGKPASGDPTGGEPGSIVITEFLERSYSAEFSTSEELKNKNEQRRQSEVVGNDLKVKRGLTPLVTENEIGTLPECGGTASQPRPQDLDVSKENSTGGKSIASSAYASDEGKTEQRTEQVRSLTLLKKKADSGANGKVNLEDEFSAAAILPRKKEKPSGPRLHRNGVFSPVGAGKQVQRAVLRAMQVWVWDEWADDGFRMVKAPDGSIWYFDPKEDFWCPDSELMPLTQMIDMANSGEDTVLMSPVDIDELNDYAIELFEVLKKNKKLLQRFNSEPAAIVCNYKLEEVDWDELPDEAFEKSEAALPF